ncbi:hypothetical protein I551_2555 [Mycobacterium ulcerans str. Harvey]|uniref:Uncharacterized protein n=1 Tax=Mycobacterium ulcerans str. Harvey TaxID=1299332 RepID=A0ABP3AI40_MYCUL|nr:hypothetical protein I551_2555 [Mycobacterium ulcerans str. Harvey]
MESSSGSASASPASSTPVWPPSMACAVLSSASDPSASATSSASFGSSSPASASSASAATSTSPSTASAASTSPTSASGASASAASPTSPSTASDASVSAVDSSPATAEPTVSGSATSAALAVSARSGWLVAFRIASWRCGGRDLAGRFGFGHFVSSGGRTTHACRILAAFGRQDDVDNCANEHERRRERVDSDASDVCSGVVAQQLDAEPPDAIQGHIGREQSTVTDCEAAVQIDQRGEYQQVPNQLVEERRLHHDRDLPGRDAVERMNVDESGGIPTIENLQAPRHRGLAAVQLLVEVIPEPTDRLAITTPGATASKKAGSGIPRRRQPIQAPTVPSVTAPQIPRPPSQMRSAAPNPAPPSPKYVCQSVLRWYRRPPIKPNGTIHKAMS